VAINADGGIDWLPDAPQPVMIASDPDLADPGKTIEIGTPFDAAGASSAATTTTVTAESALAASPSDGSDGDAAGSLVWFGGGVAAGAAATGTGVWYRKRNQQG
jgi:hypothetical protein